MHTTISTLNKFKAEKQKFSCLTCYDASFAQVSSEAEIEVLLVGDTLGMVVQGESSTLPVSVEDICYHVRAVAKTAQNCMIMADMPFMAAATLEAGLKAAMDMMQAGAHIIKLEGGLWLAPLVTQLKQQGVPVCVHLGLTPQSVHAIGGFKVQAKQDSEQEALIECAIELESAGADIVLVECIPASLTQKLYKNLKVPIIGIGAGPSCDGQILVNYDILGIPTGPKARFAKNYLKQSEDILAAYKLFRQEVIKGIYPEEKHSF